MLKSEIIPGVEIEILDVDQYKKAGFSVGFTANANAGLKVIKCENDQVTLARSDGQIINYAGNEIAHGIGISYVLNHFRLRTIIRSNIKLKIKIGDCIKPKTLEDLLDSNFDVDFINDARHGLIIFGMNLDGLVHLKRADKIPIRKKDLTWYTVSINKLDDCFRKVRKSDKNVSSTIPEKSRLELIDNNK